MEGVVVRLENPLLPEHLREGCLLEGSTLDSKGTLRLNDTDVGWLGYLQMKGLRQDLDTARATEAVAERQRQEHANMAADSLGEFGVHFLTEANFPSVPRIPIHAMTCFYPNPCRRTTVFVFKS